MRFTITGTAEGGLERFSAKPRTISEANIAARLSARAALPLSLLNEAILEKPADLTKDFKQSIWVPRNAGFDQLELGLASPLRHLYDDPPAWIVQAVRATYPDHLWWSGTANTDVQIALLILENARCASDSNDRIAWFENVGWDGATLVAEPHELTEDSITSLIRFCVNAHLHYRIQGTSNQYPSKTLRIEIAESGK